MALTGDGRRLVEAILPDHWANEERLLYALTGEERSALAGLLEGLAVSLGDGGRTPTPLRRRG